jgi:hypothetical protein
MSSKNQTETQAETAETQDGKRQFDKSYRNIFSDKESFIHFLQKYVQLPWAEWLAKDDLTQVDSNFITKEFGEFESDVIYKHEKKNMFFYILLEQQSTPDFSMPFRLLHYTVLLLAREFRNANPPKKRTPKDYRLPAVVPIVLYNGKEKWTPVRTFKEYTANHGEFGDYLIDFKYILFDLNRYNEDEILTTYKLLDFVFNMDLKHNSEDKKDFHRKLGKLAALQNELSDDDVRAFLAWIINVIFRGKTPHENFEKEVFDTFRKGDVDKMTHAFDGLLDSVADERVNESVARIVKGMLAEGDSVDKIVRVTKMPQYRVEELQQDIRPV